MGDCDYQRHNTTLDSATVTALKAYGGGNLSEGIRRAAEIVKATEATQLCCEDFDRFVDTCNSEAPTNEKLSAALRRRGERKIIGGRFDKLGRPQDRDQS